ncbi:MAG: DNA primase [Pseudomonadales bacterium]
MSGRIPQSFLDDLLARTDIVDVIDGRVNLKKAGKNYSGLCPFHNEKSPSFSVSPDKQFYYCFGCGAGGNAITFVTEFENIPFPEAVEELAKRAGLEIPREDGQHRKSDQLYQAQFRVLELASNFYQSQLKSNPTRGQAVDYLKGRGLDGQTAKRFNIGYAPPGWDNLIKSIANSSSDQENLERSGMLIRHEEKDSLYDRFRERIMFPIHDMRGRVIAFGGRVLTDAKPKYLNSPETDTFQKGRELYGLYEARQANRKLQRIVIVEGYMDVVSLAQFGINYSVATLGTATSSYHLERLFKIVPEVVFCFDGDQAGRKAAQRALETVMSMIRDGQQAKFLFLPEGEDPDTLVREHGSEHFEQLLDGAMAMSEYFFDSLSEGLDMQSIDGRAIFSSQALPLIQKMPQSLLQQMMNDRISELTGLSMEQLVSSNHLQPSYLQEQHTPQPSYDGGDIPSAYPSYSESPADNYPDSVGERYRSEQPSRRSQAPRTRSKRTADISLINRTISLLLHRPSLLQEVEPIEGIAQIDESNSDVLALLVTYWYKYPQASIGQMLVDWQDDEQYAGKLLLISEISRLNPCPDDNYQQLFNDSWERIRERKGDLTYLDIKRQQGALKSNLSSEVKQQAKAYLDEIAAKHRKRQS